MADFCLQDTIEIWGKEVAIKNDMKGLCKDDEMVAVLCEHCGNTWVDSNGFCIGPCDLHHEEYFTE